MQHPPTWQRRAAIFTMAAAGLLGATVAAACGDNSDDVSTEPAAPAAAPSPADVAGSDVHLRNLADTAEAELAQEQANAAASARMAGQAAAYARAQQAAADAYVSAQQARAQQATAADAETQAHLDGQANTFGR
jgi:hypothetical protein